MNNHLFNPDPINSGFSRHDRFRDVPFKDDEESLITKIVAGVALVVFFLLVAFYVG